MKPRALQLTKKGRAAIGAPEPPVAVPLLVLPWRPDERDKRAEK